MVDPALNQLSAPGRSVKLEPKAMAVLVHLAQRPSEVVSRETLLAAVWPGVIVSDDAVTQVVIKLRKALGDSAETPAYIQTISKRGYRLGAPVRRQGPEPQREPKRWVLWLPVLGLVVAAIVVGWMFWWITDKPAPLATSDLEAARAAQPTVTIRPFEA